MSIWTHFEALVLDLRYTCRFLIEDWTFTATVLATLAVSTGSTAAVFMLVDVLLLRQLPVRSADQLVAVGVPGRNVNVNPTYFSQAFYQHLRDSSPIFSSLIASATAIASGVNLADGAITERVRGELVSGNYFDVLGVGAAAGRVLTPEDDRTPDAHPVIVLSYAFWERRFAGAPDVIGRKFLLNGRPFTAIGVARKGFFGTSPGFGPDIWAPLMMVRALSAGVKTPEQRNDNYLELMARLQPGTSSQGAQAAATVIYGDWLAEEGTGANVAQTGARPRLDLKPASAGLSLLRGQ
jgi:hypothetical protein